MTYSFVLVHSPLIGPYSWRLVADQLGVEGHKAIVPSLLSVLKRSRGYAGAIGHEVAYDVQGGGELPDPLILAGHSAAGAYLPGIGSALGRKISSYIFVDARLPTKGRSLSAEDPPERRSQLQRLASNGMLPRWSEWFGPEAMEEALPDAKLRDAFLRELEPIPLALFEEPIPLPPAWPDAPCTYLRFSEAYVAEANEARAKGWHVSEIDAQHLYLLTHPKEAADLILEAVEVLESGGGSSKA